MALTYKTLSSNFAKVKDKSVAQLGTFIGGKVGENIKSEVFKNGCAIRLSYAFNYSGVPISPSDGAVSSGADKKWYLYRVSDMKKFIITSNPQLSPSTSFLRVHVLSLLNYQIN